MQEGRERKVEVKGILKQHVPLFVSAGTEKPLCSHFGKHRGFDDVIQMPS